MRSYCIQTFGEPLSEVDSATPEPAGSEVLLRVRAAGVCHSDLHCWEGGYDLGHGRRLSLADRGMSLPLTLGHETVGEVVAAGPEAEGIAAGDVRLIYPWQGCGTCEICTSGRENYCPKPAFLGIYKDGGYADHVLVRHPRYLIPIDGLDPAEAAPYACSGVTTFSALKKIADIFPHEPIVVIGAGGLGLMTIALLKAMGGKGAVVVDIDPAKLEAARQAGALAAVDGKAPDAVAQIHAATGGRVTAAIDLVGSAESARVGFDCLTTKGAKLIVVGLYGGAAPWPIPLVAMKAITIQGSHVGSLPELIELMALVRHANLPPIPVTCRHLHEATDALNALKAGQVIGRAVLVPS
ncbi:alcohol dehydrogenase [Marinivivus vitaminiproducens]|uniref:alcohol dehydrogenase n=1 Tax=Marinivivus vitaminiproducens TaxID=3035935 RepID=UPI0027AB7CF5|nr:alcohol dehydrogenase [Geminicoccaceae bacterium SCSIO 64248]